MSTTPEENAAAFVVIAETEAANEFLKVHLAYAKPVVSQSKWLLAASAAIASVGVANADKVSALVGEGWMRGAFCLLTASVALGLVGKAFLIRAQARANSMLILFEGMERLAHKHSAEHAALPGPGEKPMPNYEKVGTWFATPPTWAARLAYGRLDANDEDEPYRSVTKILRGHAILAAVQFFFFYAVFGVLMAGVSVQPSTPPAKTAAGAPRATIEPEITVKPHLIVQPPTITVEPNPAPKR